MLILNESECATGLYDYPKSITLIQELPFAQWRATNLHASEHSPSLILGTMSEWIIVSFREGLDRNWSLKKSNISVLIKLRKYVFFQELSLRTA